MLLWLYLWIVYALSSQAALVNVSIDDTVPDTVTGNTIIYSPADGWNIGTNCSACTARPDAAQMYDGTWHDTTFYPPNTVGSDSQNSIPAYASATFSGTAVYVSCALALTSSGPDGDSDMVFLIDGESVGSFVHTAPGTQGYQYNVIVYSNTSLTSGSHTIEIQNGQYGGPKALILLDRIIYTTGTTGTSTGSSAGNTGTSTGASTGTATPSQTTHSRSSSTGVIVGAVVGSVGGVTIIVALLIFLLTLCRRKRQNEHLEEKTPQIHPFLTNNLSNNSSPSVAPPQRVYPASNIGSEPGSLDTCHLNYDTQRNPGVGYYTVGSSVTKAERMQMHPSRPSTPQASGSSQYGTSQSGPSQSGPSEAHPEAPPPAYQQLLAEAPSSSTNEKSRLPDS